jgi:two-component system chemotaxis response regulator CheB
MPTNAIEYITVDYKLPAKAIGNMLAQLVDKDARKKPVVSAKEKKLLEMEVIISTRDNAYNLGTMDMGEYTPFTCPECYGALVQLKGNLMRFRCHTGHAFTSSSLLAGISETVEDTMWQSMRTLEESAMLLKNMSVHFAKLGYKDAAKLFLANATDTVEQARIIHDSVFTQQQLSEDLRHALSL